MSDSPGDSPSDSPGDSAGDSLAEVVREVELHAARAGWEQPAQLFALVDTADLLAREPHLAAVLGLEADEGQEGATPPGGLTPVE